MSQKYTATLEIVECIECHMDFGITPAFQAHRKKDHKLFYCPAGHPQYYPQQTPEEKLRKKLAKETHCCEQNKARVRELRRELEKEAARANGYKGAWKKAARQSVTGNDE